MKIITNEDARNFLINYQNLNGDEKLQGYDGAKEYLNKVRCVQFDPLNVVGRNPDLVLQSRVTNYKPEILADLLYKERCLIDAFDKMLSIIPLEDYPNMARIRKAEVNQLKEVLAWRDSLGALDLLDEIKAFIRENGPLPANKINIGGNARPGRWGHKKLSSAALDYLYNNGELGISCKRKTHKIYDLSERLFPKEILTAGDSFSSEHDFYKWYIKRRIAAVGLLWNKNGGAWLGHFLADQKLRTEIIGELVDQGELLSVQVEGSNEAFYLQKKDEALLGQPVKNTVVHFIAPLDNLIWDRAMTEELFDFKYTWEVYTPAARRKFGYYVLPVLYKNRFVARFEPELNREKETLKIKNWWWESDVSVTDDMQEAVNEALKRFCKYLGVKTADE